MLKTVTGFTIGHSITLSLAALGLVRLPARLIESAIALTIAYVAAEDLAKELTHKKVRPRWQIAMAFGLIHGFGFARALSDLHLPRSRLLSALVGFNLGVELGQEVVVLIVAPLLWLLYRIPRVRRLAAPVFAAGIRGGRAGLVRPAGVYRLGNLCTTLPSPRRPVPAVRFVAPPREALLQHARRCARIRTRPRPAWLDPGLCRGSLERSQEGGGGPQLC